MSRLGLEILETRLVPATLLTPGTPEGTLADGPSEVVFAVSQDGNRVLFSSRATNLVPGVIDVNSQPDLFWRDLTTNETRLITRIPGGAALGFDDSSRANAVMSADGNFVAFVSTVPAGQLTGNVGQQDQPASPDVFRWNALTNGVELVSAQNTGDGNSATVGFFAPANRPNISDNGMIVSYVTSLTNNSITAIPLNDAVGTDDIFVRNMGVSNVGGGATLPVSRSSVLPNNMVGASGSVSVLSPGRYMSGDGTVYTYSTSVSATLIVAGVIDQSTGTSDVFVRDLNRTLPDSTRLVSVIHNSTTVAIGNVPGQNAEGAIISADGKSILFVSNAPGGADANRLVNDYQSNGASNSLYVRQNPFGPGTTLLVSGKNGTPNQSGSNFGIVSGAYAITRDGAFALFNSPSPDLVASSIDINGTATDAFIRQLTDGGTLTQLVSADNAGRSGVAASLGTGISDDGRYVVFETTSPNLVPGAVDTNGVSDVFVRDRKNASTRIASSVPGGGMTGNGASNGGVLATGGTRVAFVSTAGNLTSTPFSPGTSNVFAASIPLPVPLAASQRVGIGGNPDGSVAVGTFENGPQLEIINTLKPIPAFSGAVRPTLADVNGDGVPDLIAGVGPGGGSFVSILSGTDNAVIGPPGMIYESAFLGGVFVAAADLDGDGKAEIIISPDQGGGGRIVVLKFQNNAFVRVADFFGIEDPNFRGGARVAVGDVNGDGTPDVIVAAGFGGGPRVAIFDGKSVLAVGLTTLPQKLVPDFFAFEPALRNGAFVAAGDFNADGSDDLVFGGGPGGGPRVLVLDAQRVLSNPQGAIAEPLANFFAGDSSTRGGVRVAAKDIDGDARADLVIGSGEGLPGEVRTYLGASFPVSGQGEPRLEQSLPILPQLGNLPGGIFVG